MVLGSECVVNFSGCVLSSHFQSVTYPLTIYIARGGGGGHSTSQLDRGVPLGGGGVKT